MNIKRNIEHNVKHNYNLPTPELDPELCRRARMSRDARFDGVFFLAVRTTGIYCRPVCPARSPAEKNVAYYRSATQAAQAGFRPCLRCRPESAPNSPAWNGTSTTVQRALQLITEGALNNGSLSTLAQRLGIGERYLRKLFQRELGVSPQAVALNQRLLFAKKLLAETAMPVTEVAFAAGFGSVRRFNSAVKTHFRLAPSALRGRQTAAGSDGAIRLQLHYRPPYDWQSVADLFARHAIAGVESVTEEGYRRTLGTADSPGEIRVAPLKGKNALSLELQLPDQSLLMPVVARVRRMFDLDANPEAIHAVLGKDKYLAPLLRRFPGIRSPCYGALEEAGIRAIVGQQVSTSAARSVIGRLASACHGDEDRMPFPPAARVAELGDEHFPMPGRRRETLRAWCQLAKNSSVEPGLEELGGLRGVGPWTVAMVAMRGAGQPDIFPQKDLGLENAWRELAGGIKLQDHAANWRPWGAYAANLLWRSLSP